MVTAGGTTRTREALLEAAEELFGEQGYAAVGMRELCARAGVNLAAVRYHFGCKRDLYLETVRRAMQHPEVLEVWGTLAPRPRSRAAAAHALVRFLRRFLARLSDRPALTSCTRLTLQEAMRPSEALEDVVSSFMLPNVVLLVEVLAVLSPRSSAVELRFDARGILGQLMHYLVLRPIVERSAGLDLSDPRVLREVADHVARFSLRGLRVPEALVQAAFAEDADEGES